MPAPRLLLAVGLIALATVVPASAPASHHHVEAAGAWPALARSMAGSVAVRWSASVPATAQLGAEPPGRCRQMDGRRVTCAIAIVVLARDGNGRRPWRCAATAVVSRAAGQLTARRTGTRCTPFPAFAAAPDAAGALGTAVALDANGDVACLPAHDGRLTCVMRYKDPTSGRCLAAASVPQRRPADAAPIGGPVCTAPPIRRTA